jgi:hypothetical protein
MLGPNGGEARPANDDSAGITDLIAKTRAERG